MKPNFFISYRGFWPQFSPPRASYEFEINSHDGDFAEAGDSGSFLLNSAGELVGILFGTDPFGGRFEFALMMPISEIQEDVRRLTDGGFLSLD